MGSACRLQLHVFTPSPALCCFHVLQGLSSLQALHVGFNRIAEAVDLDRLQSESRREERGSGTALGGGGQWGGGILL